MKKILYALLLTVFVLTVSVGSADAAWTSSFTTAKKILSNSGTAKPLTAVSAANVISYTLGAGETLNTNDTLVLTLTGGAVFSSTAPTLSGSGTAGDGKGFSIVGSPTGQTSANFRVAEAQLVGNTISVNTEAIIFNVASVTAGVDVRLSATTSVGGLTIFNALQSSKTGATSAFSVASAAESVFVVASTNTADVSATNGAFKKFTGGGTAGTAATFSYTVLSEDANTVPNGQSVSAAKVVFNIAGQLTGITTITTTGACTGSDAAGSTTGGAATSFKIDTAKTNAYCVNTNELVGQATLALLPVFNIDGTTAQSARGFTASAAALADGTKWVAHTALSPTALYSITRNGSSFVTNSVGALNTIKITDRSGSISGTGAITVTAWDVDGASIPEAAGATPLTLASNATTSITGTDLQARFPTVTPIKYEFAVESSNIVATSRKISTDGTVTTVTVFTTTAGQGI